MSEAKFVITVDRERCMGSGLCSFYAPNSFDLDPATVRAWAEQGWCD